MPRKPQLGKTASAPQFDDAPLDSDDEEGACPIPDEHGEVVLRRTAKAQQGGKRGKGDKAKPAR